jgi:hypothetical protein
LKKKFVAILDFAAPAPAQEIIRRVRDLVDQQIIPK